MKRRIAQTLMLFALAPFACNDNSLKERSPSNTGAIHAEQAAPEALSSHYATKNVLAMPAQEPTATAPSGTESYTDYGKNPLVDTAADHLSTFAVDVDSASYAIARRKLLEGQMPPAASVRVEEFLNYFRYTYDEPQGDAPFAVQMEMAPSPLTK